VDDEYKNSITLVGHEHSVSSAKFLPGDDRVISSSRDMTVKIWDIATKLVYPSVKPAGVDAYSLATPDIASKHCDLTRSGFALPCQVWMEV
jgi:platelet-activating factor acetylhydrolase IB subunit alpha